MVGVEIRSHDRYTFLRYLGEHMHTQPPDHDITRFFPHITSDVDGEEKECILTPGFGTYHWVHSDGERYKLTVAEEGTPTSAVNGIEYFVRVMVEHDDATKLAAFIKRALTYTKPAKAQQISIYYSKGSKGYWEHFNTTYAQPIDKIYMDPDVKRTIIDKIDAFIAAKQRYINFGRPYKINFLLTGVPGAGKTSIVKAIALKYNRKVNVLNFSKGLTDENLVSLMSEIGDNEIVLMEDIDAFFQDRESKDNNVSFSALLNIMDGTMMKGNGTMMFLTANNPDRLDPALIRPGRIDHVVRFDYPRTEEVKEAFRDITECTDDAKFRAFHKKLQGLRVNMSSIVDFLFRYSENYMDHIDELLSQTQLRMEMVNDKTEKMFI